MGAFGRGGMHRPAPTHLHGLSPPPTHASPCHAPPLPLAGPSTAECMTHEAVPHWELYRICAQAVRGVRLRVRAKRIPPLPCTQNTARRPYDAQDAPTTPTRNADTGHKQVVSNIAITAPPDSPTALSVTPSEGKNFLFFCSGRLAIHAAMCSRGNVYCRRCKHIKRPLCVTRIGHVLLPSMVMQPRNAAQHTSFQANQSLQKENPVL